MSQTSKPTKPGRTASLARRHSDLDRQIDSEMLRPLPDSLALSAMKREKLEIKDELEGIIPSGARAPSSGEGQQATA